MQLFFYLLFQGNSLKLLLLLEKNMRRVTERPRSTVANYQHEQIYNKENTFWFIRFCAKIMQLANALENWKPTQAIRNNTVFQRTI